MKPAYRYYTDKMWRDFIPRWRWNKEHGHLQQLPPVQGHNYDICADIWDNLTEKERQIIETATQSEHERVGADMQKLAERYGQRVGDIWKEAFRLCRMTGEQRGLIDSVHNLHNPKEGETDGKKHNI